MASPFHLLICRNKNMGSRSRVSGALLSGAVLIVVFVWFFYVGILANNATKRRMTRIVVASGGTWKVIGRERQHFHQDHDFHYVSKRRVPNGPDPIHNRRASKYRQPPGLT